MRTPLLIGGAIQPRFAAEHFVDQPEGMSQLLSGQGHSPAFLMPSLRFWRKSGGIRSDNSSNVAVTPP
jgi:hypothetical protein